MYRHVFNAATTQANAKGQEPVSIRDKGLIKKTTVKQYPLLNLIKECLQKYQNYFDGVCSTK